MTLFEIDHRIKALFDNAEIDEETGEVFFDEQAFDALEMAQSEKRKHVALHIKNLESDINELKNQEKAFAVRRKTKEHEMEWMRSYLMKSLNGEDFECPEVSVKLKLNPEKAVWPKGADAQIISWLKHHKLGRLVKATVTETIMKDELKKVIRSGKEIPMVTVIREQNMTIK